jgi:hypothetical protein
VCARDLALLTPRLRIGALVVAAEQQDDLVAVGSGVHSPTTTNLPRDEAVGERIFRRLAGILHQVWHWGLLPVAWAVRVFVS